MHAAGHDAPQLGYTAWKAIPIRLCSLSPNLLRDQTMVSVCVCSSTHCTDADDKACKSTARKSESAVYHVTCITCNPSSNGVSACASGQTQATQPEKTMAREVRRSIKSNTQLTDGHKTDARRAQHGEATPYRMFSLSHKLHQLQPCTQIECSCSRA